MKDLFKVLRARISEAPAAGEVDKDRGQLDRNETSPAVGFPCTLIKFNMTSTETISGNMQQCNGTLIVRYASDLGTQETSNQAPDNISDTSLEYYDGAQQVYLKLQGYSENGINFLDRISQIDEDRTDFDVVKMTFSIGFVDYSASGTNGE